MRAHTLVLILLGDDPSPRKVLVERLVQQLQTTAPIPGETITNLANKIQKKKQNSQIAAGSLRLPGRRRGSERAARRRGAAAARALPSSFLSVPISSSRGGEFLETFQLERSVVREREQRVPGGSIRSGRCGEDARLR